MRAYERFLEYVKIWTSSERCSGSAPSSLRQFDLAHQLAFELRELGVEQVGVDNHCFVYGYLPASAGCESAPCLGLLAHLDTHPDCPGQNVRPQIIEQYDGGEVVLGDSGLVLRPAEFPHLPSLAGQTLLTSSGDTLLGVDDKAGIAEILTALERVTAWCLSRTKRLAAEPPILIWNGSVPDTPIPSMDGRPARLKPRPFMRYRPKSGSGDSASIRDMPRGLW